MTIEQRLAKLERQNRWMRRAFGLALACVAFVVLMGQGKANKPGPVEATAFVLRDADGKNWGELGITDNGLCRRARGLQGTASVHGLGQVSAR